MLRLTCWTNKNKHNKGLENVTTRIIIWKICLWKASSRAEKIFSRSWKMLLVNCNKILCVRKLAFLFWFTCCWRGRFQSMVKDTARVGISWFCYLCWPTVTHANWTLRSTDSLDVWVTQTLFPIIYRETSLRQVGGALLLLVFRTEHVLFNGKARCYDLPTCIGAAVVECIPVRDDFL